MEEPCPLCNQTAENQFKLRPDRHIVTCDRCGRFEITEFVLDEVVQKGRKFYEKRHLLSGLMRERREKGLPPLPLSSENIPDLLDLAPRTPQECVDRLLLALRNQSGVFGHRYNPRDKIDWPLAYARNESEFKSYVEHAITEGYLQQPEANVVVLLMKGWLRIEELEKSGASNSNSAFVATWFDDTMDSAYSDAIKPALQEMGYEPIWLRISKNFNKIDDEITAGIRKSSLVIADFTGHRQSVYFEAGLAKGWGKNLVLTCRKDYEKHKDKGFDTEHYRHIFWKDEEDLKRALIEHITAMGWDKPVKTS